MSDFQKSMDDFLCKITAETGMSASYEFDRFGMITIDSNSDEVPDVNSKVWINLSETDENGIEQSGTLRYVENLSEQSEWGIEISHNVFFNPNPDNTDSGTQMLIDKIKSTENMNVAVGLGYSVEISRNSQTLFIDHPDLNHNITIDDSSRIITLNAVLDYSPEIGDTKVTYQMDFNGERIINRDFNEEGPFASRSALGESLISRFEKSFQPFRENSFDKIDSGFEGRSPRTISMAVEGVFSQKPLGIKENGVSRFEFSSTTNDSITIRAYTLLTDKDKGITNEDKRALMLIECNNKENGESEHYLVDNKGVVVQTLDIKNEYNLGDVVKFSLNDKETHFKDRNEHTVEEIKGIQSVVCDKIAQNIANMTPDIIDKERSVENNRLKDTMDVVVKAVTGEGVFLKENGSDEEKVQGTKMLDDVISYKKMGDIPESQRKDDSPRDITIFNKEYDSQSSIEEKSYRIMSIIGKIGTIEQNTDIIKKYVQSPETKSLIDDVKAVIERYNTNNPTLERLQWESDSMQICNSHGFTSGGKYVERADESHDGEITQNKQMVAFGDHVNVGILSINDPSVQRHIGEYKDRGFEQGTGFLDVSRHGISELEINSEYEYYKASKLMSGGVELDKIADSIESIGGLAKEFTKEFLHEFPDAIETFVKIADDGSLKDDEKISEWQKCVDNFISGKVEDLDKGTDIKGIDDNINPDENSRLSKMEEYSEAKIGFKQFKNLFPRDFQNNFFVQFKDLQLLIKAKEAGITVNEYAKKDFDLDKRDEKSIEKINNDIAIGVDRYINAGDIAAKIFSITRCNMLESLLEVLVVKICTGISDAIHEHRDRVTKDENDEKAAKDVINDSDVTEEDKIDSDNEKNPDEALGIEENPDKLEMSDEDDTDKNTDNTENNSLDEITGDAADEEQKSLQDEEVADSDDKDETENREESKKDLSDIAVDSDVQEIKADAPDDDGDDLDGDSDTDNADILQDEKKNAVDEEKIEIEVKPESSAIEDMDAYEPQQMPSEDSAAHVNDIILQPVNDNNGVDIDEQREFPTSYNDVLLGSADAGDFGDNAPNDTMIESEDYDYTSAVEEIENYLGDELISDQECDSFGDLSENDKIKVLSEVAKDVESSEQAEELGELTVRTIFDNKDDLTESSDQVRDNLTTELKESYDKGYNDEFDILDSFESDLADSYKGIVYDTDENGNITEYLPSNEEGISYVTTYSPDGTIVDIDCVNCSEEADQIADAVYDYIDSDDFKTSLNDFIDDADFVDIPDDMFFDVDSSQDDVDVSEDQSDWIPDSYWEADSDEFEAIESIFL